MRDKRTITAISVIAWVLIIFAGAASSEVTFTSLEPITAGLSTPVDVWVSDEGKVYVIDGTKKQLFIYDGGGQPAGSMSIENPKCVAVGSDGSIYIGTTKSGDISVKIYNSALKQVGALGKGAGEFIFPKNIAIDKGTGNVYVVDQSIPGFKADKIKAYTSGGAYISEINDYSNLPSDVTIYNNEIYAVEHPQILDQYGNIIRGGRVRVFDMAGKAVREFGSYGANEGQFLRPDGITSDGDGVLYITDSFHGVVLCFDTAGNYLGAIHNPSKPMVTPQGVALGGDRRLYVASLNTSSVHVFGLQGYGSMGVTPGELNFAAQEGAGNPAEQNITVSNLGAEALTYTAQSAESWIVISNPAGSINTGSAGTVTVGINTAGKSAGQYTGKVTVSGSTGVTKAVKVTLDIEAPPPPPPVLNVTPQQLEYEYKTTEAAASQSITIEVTNNEHGIATGWAAATDSAWLSIQPDAQAFTGNISAAASVNIDTTGLAAGTYNGKITIDVPGAEGSPAAVEVTLNVRQSGTIKVTCNIQEASFKIEGPANYEGSGTTWAAGEAPDGEYTITYEPVVGYKEPLSESKTISGGSVIEFEGNYAAILKKANIVVSRRATLKNAPEVGIFDKEGTKYISFVPFSASQYSSAGDKKSYGKQGVNTAVGDIDGDGKADIIAGRPEGVENPAEVAAYKADGTYIEGSDFIGLSTMNGANVEAADFDGDGRAEIVVGAGGQKKNPSQVRIYSYAGGVIADTGVNFNAFTVKGGVNLATGDIDGDKMPELITAAGENPNASPEVRVWKVNTAGGQGNWAVTDTGIRFTAFSGRYGANVTTGDLDGDGIKEIIVSSGRDPEGGANIIKAFKGDGTEYGLTITDSSVGYGLDVASADLDGDGIAEIIAGLGPSGNNQAVVKIYKADGTLSNTFTAFTGTNQGAVVSAGDLEY
jgi:hypothetical protein